MDSNSLKILISALLLISTASIVSGAFGVGFPYKISLLPGEAYEGSFSLQNVLEPTEDLTIEIIVEEGNEFITFPQSTTIQIAAGEVKDIPVRISLPEDVGAETYKVQLLFQPVLEASQQSGETVEVILAIRKSFDIDVIKEENNNLIIVLSILIAIAIIIIVILIKSSRKK